MFKSKILKVHIIILIVGLVFSYFYFMPSANAGTIVKWVDSKGITHYGDKLPAQEAGRNSSEINGHGIVVKRNVQADGKVDQQDQEKLAAQRKDNILLASYTKAEEIDLARDRNLQLDQAAAQALTTQKEGVIGRTASNQKLSEGFRQRKKPVPAYLTDELKLSQTEASKLDKQIAERKISMEATRKRFADEKARFIALKQVNTTADTTPTTQVTTSAATAAKPK